MKKSMFLLLACVLAFLFYFEVANSGQKTNLLKSLKIKLPVKIHIGGADNTEYIICFVGGAHNKALNGTVLFLELFEGNHTVCFERSGGKYGSTEFYRDKNTVVLDLYVNLSVTYNRC